MMAESDIDPDYVQDNSEKIQNEENEWLENNDEHFSDYNEDVDYDNISFLNDSESDSTGINNDEESLNSTMGHQTNDDILENEHSNESRQNSGISFTGVGRCECGCGSFEGCGDICSYCGHPYSAHSRYKK